MCIFNLRTSSLVMSTSSAEAVFRFRVEGGQLVQERFPGFSLTSRYTCRNRRHFDAEKETSKRKKGEASSTEREDGLCCDDKENGVPDKSWASSDLDLCSEGGSWFHAFKER
ncbi:hypothetical protein HPB48_016262 [Haemaphysalis longicornis]|uniref:Uncharacterized protein n=1 Tax=Haemaphysalis longicornis TaxID=44386 RepID=A0A9J6GAS2_HAELO|nr:hypothetical protein HPB48_016262 [Haemaphysalis longicornis]